MFVQQLKNGKYNPIVPVHHGYGCVPMVNEDGSLVECDTEEQAKQLREEYIRFWSDED